MSQETQIVDELGRAAHFARHNGHVGLIAYTEPLKIASNLFQPALNELNGQEMAVDASFTGAPVLVTDGGDTAAWTPSTLSGTWDFTSTTNPDAGAQCVENISNTSGDEALFSGSTLDFANYVAISGRIRLEQWGGAAGTKRVLLQFRLGGVAVGNAVEINDFIDTGLLNAYQSFAINKSEFAINEQDVDELTVQKIRDSGATPKFRLDEIQIEESGGSVVYLVEAPPKKKFIIKSLYISYIDALDITLVNNSAPNLSYDKILGVTALSNGINFQVFEDGRVISSVSTKTLGDNLKSGAAVESLVCDGTNTCITLRVDFGGPLVIDSRYDDCLRIIIQDNMTGLISCSMLASGILEPVSDIRPPEREG